MKRAAFLFVVVLFAAGVALADAPRVGVVTGTVLDPGGEPMAGATVQLVSERGTETAVSDAEGKFRFAFIIPDTYRVRADLTGFQSAEGKIIVSAGGRADVVLQLSDVAGEEIVITGEVPLINKFDVTGGGAVESKEIQNIVASVRWHKSLLQYFPGSATSDQGREYYDIEGMTGFRASHYIDGVDTSFGRLGGGSTYRMPSVAIGQLQMYATRADAEWSRSIGSFTSVVVKSGTNDFHGDLSATFQDLSWDADIKAFPEEQPPGGLDTRWEAAIGGRIVRDKLWFFAAGADLGVPGFRVLAGGDRLDEDISLKSRLLKLDSRPGQDHSLSLTGAESPTEFPFFVSNYADIYSGADFRQGGALYTLRWNWAISDDLFLDTAVSVQEALDERWEHAVSAADPAAAPWSPASNNDVSYLDAATLLFWNATAIGRPGHTSFPRDQGNVSLNWFTGNHDVKVGVDYQDTGWEVESKALPRILGYYYNPDSPGGFVVPLYLYEYTGPADIGGVENTSETWGVFVRDRITVGDHWTFNVGLRADDQTHWNDVGTEVFQSTDIAPRLTAVYDVHGDSQLLVTAGVGRYYDWIPMELTQFFNEVPQGTQEYDLSVWNAATQDFIFLTHVATAANISSNTIEPTSKDEFTLGVEWAFHPNWAFKASALYYDQGDQYSQEEQLLDDDTIALVFENIPDARQERTSLSLVVRRRYRDNWTMTASYTWSETKGNCYNVWNTYCAHGFGKLRAATNEDGVPLSVVNRDGYLANHQPHVFKVRGAYLIPLGKGHTLNLGGFAWYQSGRRWQLITQRADVLGTSDVVEYLEPAGSRKLDDPYQLDLNATWRFPIGKVLEGSFTVEVVNVTDQQEQLLITAAGMIAGDPEASVDTALFQRPRSIRALATLSF